MFSIPPMFPTDAVILFIKYVSNFVSLSKSSQNIIFNRLSVVSRSSVIWNWWFTTLHYVWIWIWFYLHIQVYLQLIDQHFDIYFISVILHCIFLWTVIKSSINYDSKNNIEKIIHHKWQSKTEETTLFKLNVILRQDVMMYIGSSYAILERTCIIENWNWGKGW